MTGQKLKIAVVGLNGQVASALITRAPKDIEIIALGRPQLELSLRETVASSLRHTGCNIIINAAAYTQVDKAEMERELAEKANATGAENVAKAAKLLSVPLLHLSTDYVFDGQLVRPYVEDDLTNPVNFYGQTKLWGEERVASTHADHVILRTSWVYSQFRNNFVKTMLKLGEDREEVSVVCDQFGNPTSANDIADALIKIARSVVANKSDRLRGVFHLSGRGEASWADFAEKIFMFSQNHGSRSIIVKRISAAEYPTPARRPINSRLNTSKLEKNYGISLPEWEISLSHCLESLLQVKN
jgi:dTDP-4-dehydrorhamnose reductase